MQTVLAHLRKLALLQEGHTLTDAQLLEAFVTRRDEAAFELLLRRHGPMVLGVCRRILGNLHDSEDAFQATFLVFARKAAGIHPSSLVGPWLHGVAQRTAMKARAVSMKRRIRERQVHPVPAGEPPQELLEQLDIEVNRLPEKYRVPVILCELEGKTRKEAARILGLSEGTLSWRLAQARKMLARRLARYSGGLSVGAVLALAQEATASVPLTLLKSTAEAALQLAAGKALQAGLVSAPVVLLAEGVLRTMVLSKLKVMGAVLAFLVGTSSLGFHYGVGAAEPKTAGSIPRVARADELDELRLEIAALRTGLQALRERVKTLEAHEPKCPAVTHSGFKVDAECRRCHDTSNETQWRSSKAPHAAVDEATRAWLEVGAFLIPRDQMYQAEADAALQRLRENPDDKESAAKLVETFKRLKEQKKEKPPAASTPKKY